MPDQSKCIQKCQSLRMLTFLTSITAVGIFLLISYLFQTSHEFFSPANASTINTFNHAASFLARDKTAFIPFVLNSSSPGVIPQTSGELPWTDSVRVQWCLDHQPYCYTGTVDTGTTGVILSAADLTGYNRSEASLYPVGWQFLTSSKILWVGNWIPRNLTFRTSTGNATAEIPILAVTKRVVCPEYIITTDGPQCLNGTGEVDMPVHIVYLGVGFGRQYNGQPQGNPDKNPFLNIMALNEKPILPFQMHTGYIVTDEGIHVGLTNDNSKGFEHGKIKLTKQIQYSGDDRDWAQTGACITAGKREGSLPACVNATILVDTGIAQMYLTLPPSIPVQRVLNESASRPGVQVPILANNQTVSVKFGSRTLTSKLLDKDPDLGYSFVVRDDRDEVVPTQVITTVSNTKAPFVNTGRHFLRRYDVLFDARDGWFGVRKKSRGEKGGDHD